MDLYGCFSLYIFRVKEAKLQSPEMGAYKAFGVEVLEEKTERILEQVSDVFLCEEEASDFVDMLNECQPELVHLTELCMDAIQ